MFQPIDPIEQHKQALIQHLVGQAGMAGGGRPVGTLMGRPFGSFVRSGVDPLLHMLANHQGENFNAGPAGGLPPGLAIAAAAQANAAANMGPQNPGVSGGLGNQSFGPPAAGPGAGGPNFGGVSPGDFYQPHPQGGFNDPFLSSALTMYGGGVKNGFGWG